MTASHLATLAISDTGFIFDPRTGHSYSTNATGLEILKALKQGLAVAQCDDLLRMAFDCPPDLSTDIETFINTLQNYDLVDAPPRGRAE